jgi:hypothetical protein
VGVQPLAWAPDYIRRPIEPDGTAIRPGDFLPQLYACNRDCHLIRVDAFWPMSGQSGYDGGICRMAAPGKGERAEQDDLQPSRFSPYELHEVGGCRHWTHGVRARRTYADLEYVKYAGGHDVFHSELRGVIPMRHDPAGGGEGFNRW